MARMAAARLVAASLVVVLVGCNGPAASGLTSPSIPARAAPSTAPSPTGSPASAAPSLAPSGEPSATPDASPVAEECGARPDDLSPGRPRLLPSSAIKVVVAELNVREAPCTTAKKRTTVEKGHVLIVWSEPYGPIRANGYTWYGVAVAPETVAAGELPPLPDSPFPDGTDNVAGWIAAGDAEQAFVEPLAARCPTTVDLENVVAMLPAERLACFDAPIVLEGTYGCGGCGGTGGAMSKPSWLADSFEFGTFRVSWTREFRDRPIALHFRPSGPQPPVDGRIIRATVHVDDPAAQNCEFAWTIEDPDFVVPAWYGVAWCRERFVVDSFEVLGTDPDYP